MTDLKERLSALDITVAVDGDEKLAVFTTTEPLFCFVCDSIEEVQALIQETLSSYARTFHQIEDVRVRLQSKEAIPVKKLRPFQYFQALLEDGAFKEVVSA